MALPRVVNSLTGLPMIRHEASVGIGMPYPRHIGFRQFAAHGLLNVAVWRKHRLASSGWQSGPSSALLRSGWHSSLRFESRPAPDRQQYETAAQHVHLAAFRASFRQLPQMRDMSGGHRPPSGVKPPRSDIPKPLPGIGRRIPPMESRQTEPIDRLGTITAFTVVSASVFTRVM